MSRWFRQSLGAVVVLAGTVSAQGQGQPARPAAQPAAAPVPTTAQPARERGPLFACGTDGNLTSPGGAYWADSGALNCVADPSQPASASNPSMRSVIGTGGTIMCFYQSNCAPVTPTLRNAVTVFLPRFNQLLASQNPAARPFPLEFDRLTDTQLGYAVAGSIQAGLIEGRALQNMQIQCVGRKTPEGDPLCPGVNDCINDAGSRVGGTAWRVKPLPQNPQGLRAEILRGVPAESPTTKRRAE